MAQSKQSKRAAGRRDEGARDVERAAAKARGKVANAPGVEPLDAERAWRGNSIEKLDFDTSDELEIFDGIVEQRRAVKAVEVGLAIHRKNYNIFVAGYSGTGRTMVVRRLLDQIAPGRPVPNDWLYVPNFQQIERPLAISVPPGDGRKLVEEVERLVEELIRELPSAFHSKEHQEKIQRILNTSIERENQAFTSLSAACEKNGFTVKSTKTGLVTVPTLDGEALSTKDFAELPEKTRARIDKKRVKLEPLISTFLEEAREIQVETQDRIRDVQSELGRDVTAPRVAGLRSAWEKHSDVADFFTALERDLLENVGGFLPDESEPDESDDAHRKLNQRYRVNLVVDHSETEGAPVIFENHPTYFNLFGKIEKRVEQGMFSTDLTMVRAGSIARASGGYLVINTAELFVGPMVWESLKSVLRNREVTIEDLAEQTNFVPSTGLRPMPIPVDVKVILIGPPEHYDILFHGDPDFIKLFQVRADFDTEISRTDQTEYEVARFIATSCRNYELRSVAKDGIGAIIEQASRQVGDKERLTLRFNDIGNLLLEADYQARKSRSKLITRKHVERAVTERVERASLFPSKMLEAMIDDQVLIDSKGEAIGRINGLAAHTVGDHTFGRPLRISASTFAGRHAIINVEREADLSGNLHSKGVMILSGWLGMRYAQDGPLALTVSLTVEQSYGWIDGDSASSAELYCIVSSLAQVPLRQDLAVTGSVNQHGEIQPIGAVNEKVEGYFDLCRARRLTRRQGVIIPVQNVRHLMLKCEVREAIAKGRFHVYPVSRVDQGIELLTGMPADEVHARAAERLARFRTISPKRPPGG